MDHTVAKIVVDIPKYNCFVPAICPVHEEEVSKITLEVAAEESGHYLRPIKPGDSSKV